MFKNCSLNSKNGIINLYTLNQKYRIVKGIPLFFIFDLCAGFDFNMWVYKNNRSFKRLFSYVAYCIENLNPIVMDIKRWYEVLMVLEA